MSPRFNDFGVSICVAVAAATILAAQDQSSGPQQPTFRTSIQSVRVDLYVTRDGNPVTDLRRDEIQLLEDGTPQAIQTFEQITVAPHTAAEPATRTLDESRQSATDPRSRLFVVFVPPRTTSAFAAPLMQARIPVLRQINNLLGPDDLVAVVTPDTPISELTFQRRLALNSSAWFDEAPEDPRHTLWDICYPSWIPGSPNSEMKARHRELMTFEALDALVAHLGGLREERKHVLVLTEGFRLYLKNPNLGAGMRSGTGPQGPRRGMGPGPGPADPVGNSMISTKQCETDRIDLGSLDHARRLDEIAAHARRNNVSFYPISPQVPSTPPGRRTFGGGAGGPFNNRTTSERQAGLRELAEDTGGTAIINTSDIDGHIQKIVAGTASYYLLGYSSTNTALDGRFRRISVRVNRPGIQVRARPGYVALPPLDSRPMPVLDTRIAPTPVEHAMRALAASRSSMLHVRSAAWSRASSSGAPSTALWFVGELDAQVQRRQSSSAWTGELTLRPTRGGSPISRAITVAAGSSTFAVEWRESDGPLTAGEYSVQLQLTDAVGQAVGEFGRVTIAEALSPLGEAILLRRGVTTGQRYVRTADPRFVRTDRLRLELPTDVTGATSAIVRDSRGAGLQIPAQIAERPDESGLFRWVVIDVPLTSLAPADYAVEVQHGGMTRVTAFRLTP